MTGVRHLDRSGLHIRVVAAGRVLMGPGRADLLEQIGALGSIAAAGRALGMSYKRAWDLVEATQHAFGTKLVEGSRGGEGGGGARLTADGARVLALYRAVEASASETSRDALRALEGIPAGHGTPSGKTRGSRVALPD